MQNDLNTRKYNENIENQTCANHNNKYAAGQCMKCRIYICLDCTRPMPYAIPQGFREAYKNIKVYLCPKCHKIETKQGHMTAILAFLMLPALIVIQWNLLIGAAVFGILILFFVGARKIQLKQEKKKGIVWF